MVDAELYSYHDGFKRLDKVEFTIFTNEEVRKISALGKDTIGIDIPDLYDNLEPKKGGLIDPRLGTTDNHIICATCGLNSTYCVGHFGHIELVEPVFHIEYLPFIKKILSCVCLKCSKLKISKNEAEIIEMLKSKSNKVRLNEIRNLVKNVQYCQKEYYGCGTPTSKIIVEKKKTSASIIVKAELMLENINQEKEQQFEKKKIVQYLSPAMIYDIFKNINNLDCMIMGINPDTSRPENMIYKVFPVPPVQIRPSISAEYLSSSTQEDDLTHKLADIVKRNITIRTFKEKISGENINKYITDHLHLLQYHTATYVNNETLTLPKSERKEKEFKSLNARLTGKYGRFRENLMGKRVDFSARTVITPDPMISINEVGVPVKIAMNLTIPEFVTPYNIEFLSKLVRNGRYTYPGANFVWQYSRKNMADQRVLPIDLRYRKEKIELAIGDLVERHLINGDVVLLNRQPSLHKQNMMSHVISVINNPALSTIRLNVADTKPYAADFDGDEMNMFLPQSIQAIVELMLIADVTKQLIVPTSSRAIIGIIQDCLLGGWLLTAPTMKIDWRNVMNIITYTNFTKFDQITKHRDYQGNELFSCIIPDKINVNKENFKIKNGQLVMGRLSSEHIGVTKKNSLQQLIMDICSNEEAKLFLDNTQRIIDNFNLYNGFTIGLGDLMIPEQMEKQINDIFETKLTKATYMITEIENNPNLMDPELFARTLFSEMNVIRDDVAKLVMNNLKESNNLNIMVSSGARGTATNIGQMCGTVGLQAFEGAMMPMRLNHRALAYFFRNDNRPESRGFIKQAYMNGLTFPSYFFLLMSARESIIEQVVKTSDTGYLQRKLVKLMEDVVVRYDMTVRTVTDNILQFVYGDSGADTTKQFDYNLRLLELGNKEIHDKYDDDAPELIRLRDLLRDTQVRTRMNYITLATHFMLPVNLQAIVDGIPQNAKESKGSIVDQAYVRDELDELLSNTRTNIICISKKHRSNAKSIKLLDEQYSKTVLRTALYECLAPSICIKKYKMTKQQFDDVLNQISKDFNKNIIEPGQMVGVLAAQCIGEPTTQATISTFHHAGIVAVASTLQGAPRIKELLSLIRHIKTPQMIIYLLEEYKDVVSMSNRIVSYINYTTLENVRTDVEVIYDPNVSEKIMTRDNVKKVFYSHNPTKTSCQSDITNMPWLVRIQLDREKMLEKEITVLDIKSKFCNAWERRYNDIKNVRKEEKRVIDKITSCAILSNTDNDEQPIIHIRFSVTEFEISIIHDFIDLLIDKVKLKGISSITNVFAVKERVLSFDNENNDIEKKNQYVIYTAGNNMYDIRYIHGIDIYKTICNDVIAMGETFGIEAARATLLRELTYVFERGGSCPNYHHIAMVIELMTCNGYLVSIDRHGMNKSENDPLSRASFEKPVEKMITAAVFNEVDNMKCVSSRIMAGLAVKGGTGLCNVYLDTEKLENSEYIDYAGKGWDSKHIYTPINKEAFVDHINKIAVDEDIFIPE